MVGDGNEKVPGHRVKKVPRKFQRRAKIHLPTFSSGCEWGETLAGDVGTSFSSFLSPRAGSILGSVLHLQCLAQGLG